MQTALKNIRRSPYQAFSAIFIVTLTMFIIGVFSLVATGSQIILNTFETKPQIIAYLKDSHTEENTNALVQKLNNTDGVKKAIYVSKQQALELYKQSVGNDPLLLGTVTDWGIVTADILPASVEITAQNPQSFNSIVTVLEQSDLISSTPQGKKEIDFPQDVITELAKWTGAIRLAGIMLVGGLSMVSLLTIVTIISMKIASRRQEIGTLKLIGARNFYIIKPYIQESIIYGVLGSFFGWLFTYICLLYSTPFLAPRLTGIISFPVGFEFMGILLGGMLLFGLVLSFISGYLAAARFVKRAK